MVTGLIIETGIFIHSRLKSFIFALFLSYIRQTLTQEIQYVC